MIFFLGLFDFNQQIHNGSIIQSTIKYGQIIRQNKADDYDGFALRPWGQFDWLFEIKNPALSRRTILGFDC